MSHVSVRITTTSSSPQLIWGKLLIIGKKNPECSEFILYFSYFFIADYKLGSSPVMKELNCVHSVYCRRTFDFSICSKSNVWCSVVDVGLCEWTWPGWCPRLQFKTSHLSVDLLSCRPFPAPPLDFYLFERKWWMTESHILTADVWPSGLCGGSFRRGVEWLKALL